MKKCWMITLTLVLALSMAMPALAANETIVIGATASPHAAILELIKDDYAELGYDLDIMVVSDYYISNPATAAGEMHANYFQHLPFLVDYNNSVDEDERLIPAIAVHCEPYGIYGGTKSALDQIAKGDRIAITNDPSNETRALLLLKDAGWIELPEGSDYNSSLTKLDIVANPYNLEIVEMNAELIPASLDDVAFAVINGNYVIEAGLSVAEDALFTEAEGYSGRVYINYVVTRPEDEQADWLIALRKVLCTQSVYEYILTNEEYKGGVIPVFEYDVE